MKEKKWIAQPTYITPLIIESSVLNSLTLIPAHSFTITKPARIRNVFIVPLNSGVFYYQISLFRDDLEFQNQIGQLGNGLVSKSTSSLFFDSGYNNLVSEFIHNGNDKLLIHPVIVNRIGSNCLFNFVVMYDLLEEIEDE